MTSPNESPHDAAWPLGPGDDAYAEAVQRVYDELRGLARRMLRGERDASGATALVNEALGRIQSKDVRFENAGHFVASASVELRRALLDRVRRRRAVKRGGGAAAVDLDRIPDRAARDLPLDDTLLVDEALEKLRAANPRHAAVVELKFFVELTHAEAAAALHVSEVTIERDWAAARRWLANELASHA